MKFMPNYIIYIVCSKKKALTMDYCNGKHFVGWHGKSRSFLFFISSILTIIPRKLVAPFARVTSFRLTYH